MVRKIKKAVWLKMEKTKNNYGKFLLLWAGELISSIGGGLTSFGLGLYIFQKTGSAADMAMLTLLGFLPALVLKIPAGVLADRYDRRLLMMIGDGLSGLGVLFILICMLTGEAALWQIYLGTTISSVFSALLEPSYTATIGKRHQADTHNRHLHILPYSRCCCSRKKLYQDKQAFQSRTVL